jgi:threonine dehydrogenase-like Zn-dependent dehydrogenase
VSGAYPLSASAKDTYRSWRSQVCTSGLQALDGCGIVEAVGEAVTLFKVGDKVCPVFPQGHHYVSHCDLSPYS